MTLAMVILAASVALVALCVLGFLRGRDAFDRLHFPGAAAVVGGPGIATALGLSGASTAIVVRAWLIAAVLVFLGGILTHATARAEWSRHRAGSGQTDEEE